MSDLVGNPEDRFSQNEAHLWTFKRALNSKENSADKKTTVY